MSTAQLRGFLSQNGISYSGVTRADGSFGNARKRDLLLRATALRRDYETYVLPYSGNADVNRPVAPPTLTDASGLAAVMAVAAAKHASPAAALAALRRVAASASAQASAPEPFVTHRLPPHSQFAMRTLSANELTEPTSAMASVKSTQIHDLSSRIPAIGAAQGSLPLTVDGLATPLKKRKRSRLLDCGEAATSAKQNAAPQHCQDPSSATLGISRATADSFAVDKSAFAMLPVGAASSYPPYPPVASPALVAPDMVRVPSTVVTPSASCSAELVHCAHPFRGRLAQSLAYAPALTRPTRLRRASLDSSSAAAIWPSESVEVLATVPMPEFAPSVPGIFAQRSPRHEPNLIQANELTAAPASGHPAIESTAPEIAPVFWPSDSKTIEGAVERVLRNGQSAYAVWHNMPVLSFSPTREQVNREVTRVLSTWKKHMELLGLHHTSLQSAEMKRVQENSGKLSDMESAATTGRSDAEGGVDYGDNDDALASMHVESSR
jgi:hypothetical protein